MSDEPAAGAPRYLAGGLSEKGRRESNEDAAILATLAPPSPLRAFAVLSDGMGGHNAGEVASRITVEVFKEKVRAFAARPDASALPAAALESEIRAWIAEVNREIYQKGKVSAEQRGMGATLAFAMVLGDDRLVVANVGDSKIFLVSGLNVRQLSVDHTALAEHRRALGSDSVAPEDDASNPFAHALTRSLGQEKEVEPDVRTDVTLALGDVVILTTDGVTDVLEAERFLTALETTSSLQEAAAEIYRLAFEAGSKDNVSVALLSRGTPARPAAARAGKAAPAEAAPDEAAPAAQPAPDEDAVFVAGAAEGPSVPLRAERRSSRLLLGAGVAVLAAMAAATFVALRRPAGPPRTAAAPAAGLPAAPTPAAPVPTADSAAPEASPSPAPAAVGSPAAAPAPAASSPAAPRTPAARAPREPSFREPAALSGLQPLEFPPTPTPTATATLTPTFTATETATPTPPPTAPPGKEPSAPAPRPAPTPAVT